VSSLLRRQVLIPLLLAIVGGGAYVTRPWAANEPVAQTQAAPAPAGRAAAARPGDAVADVRLELLEGAATDPGSISRNPFRFLPRVAPAPEASVRRAPQPSEFTAPPVPTGPPPPPPITLRFIGLIEGAPRAGRVALLSDGRGGLMYGKEGDTVEGRYRMLRVGTDSIEMAYVDGRGRQTIRLSGQ
jgi:hypothetical protein